MGRIQILPIIALWTHPRQRGDSIEDAATSNELLRKPLNPNPCPPEFRGEESHRKPLSFGILVERGYENGFTLILIRD